MYQKFYGLGDKPFRLSPDARFFFPAVSHARALAYLRYGLHQGEGFVVVTGDAGLGKTLLADVLLAELPTERFRVGRVLMTSLAEDELLRAIAYAFDTHFLGGTKAALLQHLERIWCANTRLGQHNLLVVDEAHNLSPRCLEELRMLSNFQAGPRGMLQIILLGQSQLQEALHDGDLEELRQRIIGAHHLRPMNPAETRGYIEHRLQRAGWQGDPEFAEAVHPLIYAYTDGVPRCVNAICDRLLLFGYLEGLHRLDTGAFDTVAAELGGDWTLEAAAQAVVQASSGRRASVPLIMPSGGAAPSVPTMPQVAAVDEAATSACANEEIDTTVAYVRVAVPTAAPTRPRPRLLYGLGALAAAVIATVVLYESPDSPPHGIPATVVVAAPDTPVHNATSTAPATPAATITDLAPPPAMAPGEAGPVPIATPQQEAPVPLAITTRMPPATIKTPPQPAQAPSPPLGDTAAVNPAPLTPSPPLPEPPPQVAQIAPVATTPPPPPAPAVAPPPAAVIAAPSAPSAEEAREVALDQLLNTLVHAYEAGDLRRLLSLFAETAHTNDRQDLTGIAQDYQELFKSTIRRSMRVGGMDWSEQRGRLQGRGAFDVTVWPQGQRDPLRYRGTLTLTVAPTGEGMLITQMEHAYRK